jgi:hypothetical protein
LHKIFNARQNIVISLIDYSGVVEHYYIIVALLLLFSVNLSVFYKKTSYLMYAHVLLILASADSIVGDVTVLYLNYNTDAFNISLLNGFFVVHPLLMLAFYLSFFLYIVGVYFELTLYSCIRLKNHTCINGFKFDLTQLWLTFIVLALFLGVWWAFQEIN